MRKLISEKNYEHLKKFCAGFSRIFSGKLTWDEIAKELINVSEVLSHVGDVLCELRPVSAWSLPSVSHTPSSSQVWFRLLVWVRKLTHSLRSMVCNIVNWLTWHWLSTISCLFLSWYYRIIDCHYMVFNMVKHIVVCLYFMYMCICRCHLLGLSIYIIL